MAINYSLIILCHTDRTDHTDFIFISRRERRERRSHWFYLLSRRNEGNKGNYFRPRIDRMIRILYLSRKSQIAQKDNPLDGFIDGGISIYKNKFLAYFSHHQWLIHLTEWIRVFHFFEELLRASFQYSSNQLKRPSIK